MRLVRYSSCRVDVRLDVEEVAAGLDRHHDFLERGVACALADAVDAGLDLPRASAYGRQRVRDGEAEVVVAVDARSRALWMFGTCSRMSRMYSLELLRDSVADGVRDVHRRRAGINALLQHPVDELAVGARGIHRAELDVAAVAGSARDHRPGHLEHRLLVLRELVHDVDVASSRGRRECAAARRTFTASQQASTASGFACARPAICEPRICFAIACTASKSPGEVLGNPASMMSTPKRSSCLAISILSAAVSATPGDCSPSRRVVSKISTFSIVLLRAVAAKSGVALDSRSRSALRPLSRGTRAGEV